MSTRERPRLEPGALSLPACEEASMGRVPQRCTVDGCDAKHKARGWCDKHYMRWVRTGDPLAVKPPQLPPGRERNPPKTYAWAHQQLNTDRGRARDMLCVDCGGKAREWSYWAVCADEMADATGTDAGRPFCPHHEHYEPRCKRCHNIFDGVIHKSG
jgi:hypothetical protein